MKKQPPKAHEVITVYPLGGNSEVMKKYLVIAPSTSKALSLLSLGAGERVLQAREMQEHHVIVGGRK